MATALRTVCSRNDNWGPILYGDYNVNNYISLNDGPKAYKSYQSEVNWCRNIAEVDGSCYGAGVQYIVKSHTVCEGNARELRYSCDQCGEKTTYGEIHEKEDFIYLCSDCFNQLEALPNGKIKESIEDLLIGNVI